MTDNPIREPEPPDPRLDRADEATNAESEDEPAMRPSAAEGDAATDSGPRPPRPSQAEGDRTGE
jgi:hypothetical protein